MRIVNVSKLKGDEVLGKKIYDDSGRVLLNEGVKLTAFYIGRLKNMGVQYVYVEDQISREVIIEENISEKTRQMSKHTVKEMIDKYSREGKTDSMGVAKSVNSIIDDILLHKSVMINMPEIRSSDNNIYAHSINVCVVSAIIGIHMGYNMSKLKDIAIGAILHDIGKSKIKNDKKIVEKIKNQDELGKYIELMHPKVGYDFLGEQNLVSVHSKVAVLMHHEKVDGSGYPLKLKGDEISETARLVSICDIFDNMICGKGDVEPKPIYEVIEYLVGMSEIYFDVEIVKKFTMNLAAFPNGCGVVLNTHEKCLVVRQNKAMPVRPVVKVIFDKYGNAVPEPYEINLVEELTVFVTRTCEF